MLKIEEIRDDIIFGVDIRGMWYILLNYFEYFFVVYDYEEGILFWREREIRLRFSRFFSVLDIRDCVK